MPVDYISVSKNFLLLVCCGFSQQMLAQEYKITNPRQPAFAEVTEDPKLPRVLLIGDSISMGYTVDVRKKLMGQANVYRIPENGGPTTRGLEKIDHWLGDKKWDVIHFNWGLHDIKYIDDKEKLVDINLGKQLVSPEEYEQNLIQLVAKLQKTGAKLIWRNTTPFLEGSQGRKTEDVVKYNAIAEKIMQQHNILIDDMYKYVLPHMKEWQLPNANVHFTPAGSDKLAEDVVKHIKTQLVMNDNKEEGFVSLFDGSTSNDWEKDVKVVEGCLEGDGCYIKQKYSDFILRYDFKLAPGANSGIGIRSEQGKNAAYEGMEIQVLDDPAPVYKNLKQWQYCCSIYGVVPAKQGHLKPTGEWNSAEIHAEGNKVKVTLNGTVVVEADILEASKDGTMDGQKHPGLLNKDGYIRFCGHGGGVLFKNLYIKELN